MLGSILLLPILWQRISPQISIHPALHVLWLLISQLSLPLFIVSTTAPMVQYWFSQTNDARAQDPYFLYSASNIGSLVALLGFPLLFEPLFGLQQLSKYWSIIYVIFLLIHGSAYVGYS